MRREDEEITQRCLEHSPRAFTAEERTFGSLSSSALTMRCMAMSIASLSPAGEKKQDIHRASRSSRNHSHWGKNLPRAVTVAWRICRSLSSNTSRIRGTAAPIDLTSPTGNKKSRCALRRRKNYLHCLKHMRSLSRPARALMASAIPSSVEFASMHSNTIASVASVFWFVAEIRNNWAAYKRNEYFVYAVPSH